MLPPACPCRTGFFSSFRPRSVGKRTDPLYPIPPLRSSTARSRTISGSLRNPFRPRALPARDPGPLDSNRKRLRSRRESATKKRGYRSLDRPGLGQPENAHPFFPSPALLEKGDPLKTFQHVPLGSEKRTSTKTPMLRHVFPPYRKAKRMISSHSGRHVSLKTCRGSLPLRREIVARGRARRDNQLSLRVEALAKFFPRRERRLWG